MSRTRGLRNPRRPNSDLPYIYLAARNHRHAVQEGERALVILSTLSQRARGSYVSLDDLAVGFMAIGDHASALDLLEQAFDQRAMRVMALGDPEFDALRREPRYRRLRNRLQRPTAAM